VITNNNHKNQFVEYRLHWAQNSNSIANLYV